jgi:hypothetical protein
MDIKRVITTNFDFIKFKLSYELFKNSNSLLANTIYSFQSSNEDISIDYDVSSIPVLLYHGIINNEDRFSISKDRFFDHISSLKKAGWHTVSLSDLESFNRGEKELDDKSFVLTFDDGRVDSYKNADPILKAVGYNAVMYIAVNSSIKSEDEKKSTYYIGNEDIKNMINSGRWEIGSHAIQESGGYVTISEDGEKGNFLSNKKFGVKLATFGASDYQDKKTITYNGKTFSSYAVNRDLPLRERTKELDSKIQIALHNSKTNVSKLEKAFEIMVKTFALPFQILTACGQSQGTWFPAGASTAIMDSGGMGRVMSPVLPTGMTGH